MKRMMAVLACLLMFSYSGCSQGSSKPVVRNDETGIWNYREVGDNETYTGARNVGTAQELTYYEYRDGTYTGLGDRNVYGNDKVTIIVKERRIVFVKFTKLDINDREVKYKGSNNARYRVDLASEIIRQQTYNVNIASDSTETVQNCIIAAKRALEKASK